MLKNCMTSRAKFSLATVPAWMSMPDGIGKRYATRAIYLPERRAGPRIAQLSMTWGPENEPHTVQLDRLSILRGPLHVIDHQHSEFRLRRYQLQPKLLS